MPQEGTFRRSPSYLMTTFKLSDIINTLSCTVYGPYDGLVNSFIFDSRSLESPDGTMFCAITTDSSDGHTFIPQLYRRGVRMFMVERLPDAHDNYSDATFIVVPSATDAIARLAIAHRANIHGNVAAITGSAGKTIVKELIYQALCRSANRVARSPRSWNSRLGVPLSILEAPSGSDIVLVEAGIDTTGDMEHHAEVIRPNIGILTTITTEHDAGFANRESKIREKLKLFEGARTIIYDASQPDVDALLRDTYPHAELVPVHAAAGEATDRALADAFLSLLDEKLPDDIDIVSNRIDVHEGINDCMMFYDAFTHDLRSLRQSLDMMRRRSTATRTSTLIISDLLHAPDDNVQALYNDLAQLASVYGISRIITIGHELDKYFSAAGYGINVEKLASTNDFLRDYDINRFSSESILISGTPANEFLKIKSSLEAPRHDTIFEIDLDAVVHNFNYYRSLLKPGTGIVGMVKASAYGTGSLEVSKTLQAQGAAYLAVAVVDEGVELRRGGITMPIVVLNPVTTNYPALFRYRLEPSVFSLRELRILVDEARKNGIDRFKAHIKLDTGMHRVGFVEEELPALITALNESPELEVASIFSHLATADCPDESAYTAMQLDTFDRASQRIIDALPYRPLRHILNTAGIMTHAEHQYDMVRLGIGLYGVSPLERDTEHLYPVATLKSTVIALHRWPAGTTIGYGRRGILNRDSVIATVPIGYADGLNRHLSRGATSFVIRGIECPTMGNICMDQCMVDVTDVSDVAIGDEVEIFGKQMPVERLASILDTIPYELIATVSPRVKRVYYKS